MRSRRQAAAVAAAVGMTAAVGCDESPDSAEPISLQVEADITIAAGNDHSCALIDQGAVKCWGNNAHAQLGLGDSPWRGDGAREMGDSLPAVNLGSDEAPVALAAGELHTCALLKDGSVKCWGANDYGQLGLGDIDERGDDAGEMGDKLPAVDLGSGKKAVALAAADHHTCALLDDGSVKCWGANGYGELGLGDTAHRGVGPGEMGDALPAVNLGSEKAAVALVAGGSHTCALLDDHSMKCWGHNDNGQLGLGDSADRGDGPDEMGDALPAVDLGSWQIAVALVAGTNHTCARLKDGSVKCWGYNGNGQLGLGDTVQRGDGPDEMGDDLPAVNLGSGKTAAALAAGDHHTCALLDEGSVKCWGYNDSGRLGLGDTIARGDNPREMGDDLPAVSLGSGKTAVALAAGGRHACASLSDGSVKCWGQNASGQLGLGDTASRGDNRGDMGDALPAVKVFFPLR